MESILIFFDWYVDFVEAKGGEWSSAIFWTSLFVLALTITYLSWRLTTRKPLGYELFLVEMHHFEHRRVVEMIHLPTRSRNADHWFSDDIRVMRERVSRRSESSDGQWISVSEPTVLSAGPATIMHPSSRRIQSHRGSILWEIELHAWDVSPDGDRHLAAAAAIAILSRPNLPLSERLSFQIVEGNDPAIAETNSPMIRAQISRHGPNVIQLPVFNFSMDIVEASETGSLSVPEGNVGYVRSQDEVEVAEVADSEDPEVDTSSARLDANELYEHSDDPPTNPTNIMRVMAPTVDEVPFTQAEAAEVMGTPYVESESEAVTLRIKFLDDTQKEVQTSLDIDIGFFKKKFFPEAVVNQKVIRLIFQGQLLRDDTRTLQSYGVQNGSVVHCAIGNKPYSAPKPSTSSVPPTVNRSRNVASNNLPEGERQANADNSHENVIQDRTDLWFARVFFALITTNLATAPLIFRDWIFNMLEFIRPPLATPEDSSFMRFYRNWYTLFIVPLLPVEDVDPVATAADAAAGRQNTFCIGDYMYWIFGVQCAVVWAFVYSFPQLRDRTSVGILVLFTLYLFFVVLRYSRVPSNGQNERTAADHASRTPENVPVQQ